MTIHDWCEYMTCFDIENYKVQKDGKTYLLEGYYDMLSKFGDEELDEIYLYINENGYIDLIFRVAKEEEENIFD